MLPRLCLFFFALNFLCDALEEPCPVFVSVDITDGVKNDHTITKDNVTYTPANYFSHEGRIRGCVCNIKPCIRKCCPKGHIMKNGDCDRDDYKQKFRIHSKTDPTQVADDHFYYIHNHDCVSMASYPLNPDADERDLHYLQADGSLFWPSSGVKQIFGVDEYCVETFADGDFNYTDTALICFTGPEETDEGFYIGKKIVHFLYLFTLFILLHFLDDVSIIFCLTLILISTYAKVKTIL